MKQRFLAGLFPALGLALALAAGPALGAGPAAAAPARTVPAKAAVTLSHDDGRIGTYVSSGRGFSTSSYWIEGPQGLILIDTQFLLSAADELVDWAERATGKKVRLALVLHPNPDKFNGTEVLKRRGIEVLTSDQVRGLIPEVHADRHHWFYDRFKPDYPDKAPQPGSFGAASRTLSAAGLSLKLHVLGPGCSEAHVVVEYDGHVFVGDLVANNHHSWLEIGKTDQWLARLAEIRALKPAFVHPGRGPSAGPELLDRQEAYLRKVIKRVQDAQVKLTGGAAAAIPAAETAAAEAAIAAVKAQLLEDYPGFGNDYFLEVGLPAEWDRQARHKDRAKVR